MATTADTTASILPKSLSLLGISVEEKIYDGTTAATVDASSATFTGEVSGDHVALNAGTLSAAFADKNAGAGKPVTVAGFALSGADASNYTLNSGSFAGIIGSILPKALSVTADGKRKLTGESDPALTFTYSGLIEGDASALFTGALARDPGETMGSYSILQNTLAATGNYAIGNFTPGTLQIVGLPVVGLPDSVQASVAGLSAQTATRQQAVDWAMPSTDGVESLTPLAPEVGRYLPPQLPETAGLSVFIDPQLQQRFDLPPEL